MVTETFFIHALGELGLLEVPSESYIIFRNMKRLTDWSDEKCIAFIARACGAKVGNIDADFDKSIKNTIK